MTQRWIERVSKASGHIQEEPRDLEAGERILAEVAVEMAAAGTSSAYVEWLLGVCADYDGRPHDALPHFSRAMELDPGNIQMLRSVGIAASRLGAAVRGELGYDGEGRLRCYALLVTTPHAEPRDHLAAARLHLERGEPDEARRIAESVAVLSPGEPGVWDLLAHIADRLGDDALRARVEKRRPAAQDALRRLSGRRIDA